MQAPNVKELKTFSNKIIKTTGAIITNLNSNDKKATNFKITGLEEGHRIIIGRDLLPIWLTIHFFKNKKQKNGINQNRFPIQNKNFTKFLILFHLLVTLKYIQ